jgi:hypothetical protein
MPSFIVSSPIAVRHLTCGRHSSTTTIIAVHYGREPLWLLVGSSRSRCASAGSLAAHH